MGRKHSLYLTILCTIIALAISSISGMEINTHINKIQDPHNHPIVT